MNRQPIEEDRARAVPIPASTSPGARSTDPETSHQAAKRAPTIRQFDRRRALLALAKNPDGLTDYELAAIIQRQQNSAGKRRGELRDEGLVEATTIRRPSPMGSPTIVWRITDAGLKAAQELLS